LALLSLPREIGIHPTNGEMITAGIGRYGPFLKFSDAYVSIPADDTVITIGLNHAVELIDTSGKTAARVLGAYGDAGEIKLKDGRFGPYVEVDGIRATIPKRFDPDALTLEEAIQLIEAKKAKGPSTRGKKAAKKASAKTKKKTVAKKAGAKKTASSS